MLTTSVIYWELSVDVDVLVLSVLIVKFEISSGWLKLKFEKGSGITFTSTLLSI